MQEKTTQTSQAFDRLYNIIKTLRGPEGCPWDKEQTPESMRGDLLEEAYETVQAIDEKDSTHIQEELGDVILVASMLAYMHEQNNEFTLADVLNTLSEKLIRRHPHVFGDAKAENSAEVLAQWDEIKTKVEGRPAKTSLIDQISRGLPPLERSYKMLKKVSKNGFEWPEWSHAWDKVDEEKKEVLEILQQEENARHPIAKDRLEEEMGDLLLAVVGTARMHGIDPSLALAKANDKFEKRYRFVEKKQKETQKPLEIKELLNLWNQAKELNN